MKVTVRVKPRKVVPVKEVKVTTEFIRLDSFLKFSDAIPTGGLAKMVILDELVSVNGEVCTSRGKKLFKGDTVEYDGTCYRVV